MFQGKKMFMEKQKSEKVVKALQIVSIVFVVGMLVAALILIKKYNVSVSNAEYFKEKLRRFNPVYVALIIIAANFIKSFALVITPSLMFVICGLVFDDLWLAILVSIICVATSSPFPFLLGRFTGKNMADKLRKKYPKVDKLFGFADENAFMVVFLIKATGALPSDSSSMIFGALDFDFKTFYGATMIGQLPLIITWCLLGNKGSFNDPKTALYVIPIIVFALVASLFMKLWTDKKSKTKEQSK